MIADIVIFGPLEAGPERTSCCSVPVNEPSVSSPSIGAGGYGRVNGREAYVAPPDSSHVVCPGWSLPIENETPSDPGVKVSRANDGVASVETSAAASRIAAGRAKNMAHTSID